MNEFRKKEVAEWGAIMFMLGISVVALTLWQMAQIPSRPRASSPALTLEQAYLQSARY